MNKINSILDEMNTGSRNEFIPPFVSPNSKFTELDYRIVNKLFKTFQSIFPAFKQAWPTDSEFENAKREWMKAFKLANLQDIEAIKRGVNSYRLAPTPFVPSPGQFIELCKKPNTPACHKTYAPELEGPISTKESALTHLAKLKEMLL